MVTGRKPLELLPDQHWEICCLTLCINRFGERHRETISPSTHSHIPNGQWRAGNQIKRAENRKQLSLFANYIII